jgi:vacuolar-type H+-ATPase subunit I/STV1
MDKITATLEGGPENDTTSPDADESTSKVNTPKTYTEAERQKAVSDALAKQGREHKRALGIITGERDSLLRQIGTVESTLENTKAEAEQLKNDIKDMSSGDPAKFDLIKREGELRTKIATLDAKEKELEAEKEKHNERITKAEELEREILILEIIEDYDDANATKLIKLCEKAKAITEEDIREIADELFTKKPTPGKGKVLNVDSGVNRGEHSSLEGLSNRELLKRAYSSKK